jgi:hypothetical protein
MALKLNSSGGGSVTIDPVSTASNVTITIPATPVGSVVVADSSGNVTATGNVSGVNGTFTGPVSGTTGTFTGNVQMASANGGQLAGLRNRVINGDFRIFQRGTSITASAGTATYTLDRWKVSATGAAVTVTQASASTAYSNLASYLITTGAASNTGTNVQQFIESANSRDLAGQTVTLSYWIYNNTGSSFTAISGFYYPTVTDTFATVTAINATAGGTVCPNATWTQITVSQAIPSAATTGLMIVLGGSQTVLAGQSIRYGNVQLEVGTVATPFEQRPIGMELALCQRYCQINTYAMTVAKATAVAQFMPIVWNVPFRTTPSLLTYSGFVDNDTSGATGLTIYTPTANGASGFSVAGTATVGSRLSVVANISAEL